ncbi:SHOCT domain-containing protein [Streptomyces sp. GMY01]|uniref:SHOCT domain-containing protein n=1 Tax=Streptomyces sp. GMY02 TaxID=1333528 RepID=UPI00146F43F8|nr:SHOCT domain-containing protein [Streptomyces sp. GMY02]NMO33222.1 SHOCT domain-containing protein [Streptomyces sp. GMY02]
MQTLANWDGSGPGPWVLLFPLFWAAAIAGVVTLLRRTRRGAGGPWAGPAAPWRGVDGRPAGDSPPAVLGRRFASGEIDEDEYWRRLSVLEEHFGRTEKNGVR